MCSDYGQEIRGRVLCTMSLPSKPGLCARMEHGEDTPSPALASGTVVGQGKLPEHGYVGHPSGKWSHVGSQR